MGFRQAWNDGSWSVVGQGRGDGEWVNRASRNDGFTSTIAQTQGKKVIDQWDMKGRKTLDSGAKSRQNDGLASTIAQTQGKRSHGPVGFEQQALSRFPPVIQLTRSSVTPPMPSFRLAGIQRLCLFFFCGFVFFLFLQ